MNHHKKLKSHLDKMLKHHSEANKYLDKMMEKEGKVKINGKRKTKTSKSYKISKKL